MSRQPTLSFYGVKTQVKHRNTESEIKIPDFYVPSKTTCIQCPHYDKKFANKQGFSVHTKCVHGHQEIGEQ